MFLQFLFALTSLFIQDKEETLRDDTAPSSSRNQDKEEILSDIGPSSSHIQN